MNTYIFAHAAKVKRQPNPFTHKVEDVREPIGEEHIFQASVIQGARKKKEIPSVYALCGKTLHEVGPFPKQTPKRVGLPMCKECESAFKEQENWTKWAISKD